MESYTIIAASRHHDFARRGWIWSRKYPSPRRERVIRIFPNRESAIRLLGAVLMERHEQWTTGHRYLDMTAYWQWRDAQPLLYPILFSGLHRGPSREPVSAASQRP